MRKGRWVSGDDFPNLDAKKLTARGSVGRVRLFRAILPRIVLLLLLDAVADGVGGPSRVEVAPSRVARGHSPLVLVIPRGLLAVDTAAGLVTVSPGVRSVPCGSRPAP